MHLLFLKPTSVPTVSGDIVSDRADEQRALLAENALDETANVPANLGTSGYDVLPPHRPGESGRHQA